MVSSLSIGKTPLPKPRANASQLHGKLAQMGGAWKATGLKLRTILAQSYYGSHDGKKSDAGRSPVSGKI
jgi:hypothetical protein